MRTPDRLLSGIDGFSGFLVSADRIRRFRADTGRQSFDHSLLLDIPAAEIGIQTVLLQKDIVFIGTDFLHTKNRVLVVMLDAAEGTDSCGGFLSGFGLDGEGGMIKRSSR